MEFAAVVVMVLVLLALIGVLVFLVWDYFKYKDETNTNFAKATKAVDDEKSERLSNLKYMVDQVNTVNTDIYNTFSSNVQLHAQRIGGVETTQTGIIGGLNSFLTFSSNVSVAPGASAGPISLLDMPGMKNPDVRLIKHVTAVSGMTINDLTASSNTVMLCGRDDPTRCIRFPDSDGNTFITSLVPNKNVIVDVPTEFRNTVSLKSGTNEYATLSSVANGALNDAVFESKNNMFLKAGKVGISTNSFTPEAALHVMSYTNDPIFKAQSSATGASPVVINADGTVQVNNMKVTKLQIGDDANPIVIQKENNVLKISAPSGIEVATDASATTFKNKLVLEDTNTTIGTAASQYGILNLYSGARPTPTTTAVAAATSVKVAATAPTKPKP
jgi:hypothetical protein